MDAKHFVVPLFVTVLSAAVLAVLYTQFYVLHHDVAGNLLSGVMATELGAAFDTYNAYFPPIEKAWYRLAHAVGGVTGMGAPIAFVMLSFVLTVISAGLAFIVRHKAVGAGAMFYCVSLVVLFALPVLYKNIFGLREHLIMLGFWPYLVLRASVTDARVLPVWLRLVVGLWLGVMLAFKYFYSIAVFLIELADAIAQRRPMHLFRIENLIAAGLVFIYLLLWLGINAEQRSAMLTMRSAIGANIASSEAGLIISGRIIGSAVVLWLLAFRFQLSARKASIGLALVTGAVVVAWLQQRWYTHHLFPVFAAFLAWWWMHAAKLRPVIHIAATAALAFQLQSQFVKTAPYQQEVDAVADVLANEGIDLYGERIGLLNQHPSPFSQVIAAQGGIRWSPYVNISYVSAALKPFDLPDARGDTAPAVDLSGPGQQLLHGNLMALWQDHPPDVLILDTSRQWPLVYMQFWWEDVFMLDPAFNDILANYALEFTYEGQGLAFAYYTRKLD